jgi:hypothetical protein
MKLHLGIDIVRISSKYNRFQINGSNICVQSKHGWLNSLLIAFSFYALTEAGHFIDSNTRRRIQIIVSNSTSLDFDETIKNVFSVLNLSEPPNLNTILDYDISILDLDLVKKQFLDYRVKKNKPVMGTSLVALPAPIKVKSKPTNAKLKTLERRIKNQEVKLKGLIELTTSVQKELGETLNITSLAFTKSVNRILSFR